MDVIENWNLLNERMQSENPQMISKLLQVHMGAFDDLRKSGHLLNIGGKKVSEIAPLISPEERLELIAQIGSSLVNITGDMFTKTMKIKLADNFPNCIYILIAAILENLEGAINVILQDKKMIIQCVYDTIDGNNDPLGKILPSLAEIFTWVEIVPQPNTIKPAPAPKRPVITRENAKTVFVAESVARIDTMRTGFTGKLIKGSICSKRDALTVTDGSGNVLCNEGIVLAIFADGHEIQKVEAGERIDEMCVAVEIPNGSYQGILLVGGYNQPQKEENSVQSNATKEAAQEKQKNIISKLFSQFKNN